jgi:tetratricopeptide (TPR) repeat protein
LPAAALAALLFAVHPIHTESVAWSAGRSDVLATLFSLAALLLHIGTTRADWRRSLAVGVCILLALGAKETAIAIFPALLLYDVMMRPERPRAIEWVLRWSGPLVGTIVYVLLRRATIGDFVGAAPGEASISASLGTVVGAIGVYAGKLLWPVNLNAYIDSVPTGAIGWSVSAVAVAIAAAVAVWSWARGEKVPAFLVAWMAACLAPSLTIAWKIPEAPLAERYLYFPSVAFCLLIGCGVAAAATRLTESTRRVGAALLGVVLIACAVVTVRRNAVWHDDVRLWEDTSRKSSVAGMPLRSLGAAYHAQGRRDEARRTFEAALGRRNSAIGMLVIHNNLGTIAMLEGRLGDAEDHYRKALHIEASAPDTLFNLGLVLLERGGRTREAAEQASPYLLRALAASPFDPDVQAAVGQMKGILGDRPAAVQHLERALELGLNPVSAKRVEALLSELRAPP